MWVDNQYSWLESVRYGVGYLIAPARQTAVVPLSIAEWMSENATLRRELLKENKILAARNLDRKSVV